MEKIRKVSTKRFDFLKSLNSETGIASRYFYPFSEYLKKHPDIVVILYLRLSAKEQARRKNFKNYEKFLREELARLEVPIEACFKDICSGSIFTDRGRLKAVIEKAKNLDTKAVILAYSPDRFLRHFFYEKNHPEVLPTKLEYELLRNFTEDLTLLTFLHPDTPPLKVRGEQTGLGMKTKGKFGGRPPKAGNKKKRRLENMEKTLLLYKAGYNKSEISRLLEIPRSTIDDWIKKKERV